MACLLSDMAFILNQANEYFVPLMIINTGQRRYWQAKERWQHLVDTLTQTLQNRRNGLRMFYLQHWLHCLFSGLSKISILIFTFFIHAQGGADAASATNVLYVTTTKTIYVFDTGKVVVEVCDKNFKPVSGTIIQTTCFGRDPDACTE